LCRSKDAAGRKSGIRGSTGAMNGVFASGAVRDAVVDVAGVVDRSTCLPQSHAPDEPQCDLPPRGVSSSHWLSGDCRSFAAQCGQLGLPDSVASVLQQRLHSASSVPLPQQLPAPMAQLFELAQQQEDASIQSKLTKVNATIATCVIRNGIEPFIASILRRRPKLDQWMSDLADF
jgi:hypothetical protein